MVTLGTIACPGRCGGRVGVHVKAVASISQLTVTLDRFDVRRHALCLTPPRNDGEPLARAA